MKEKLEPGMTAVILSFVHILAQSGTISPEHVTAFEELVTSPNSSSPRLVPARAVADQLGTSKKTVHRLAARGVLTKVLLDPKNPQTVRFRQDEVDRIVAGEADSNLGREGD